MVGLPLDGVQVFVAPAPCVELASEEPVGNCVGEAGGHLLSAGRGFLGGKTRAAALLYLIGWLAHGFLCNGAPLASGERGFRLIDCG